MRPLSGTWDLISFQSFDFLVNCISEPHASSTVQQRGGWSCPPNHSQTYKYEKIDLKYRTRTAGAFELSDGSDGQIERDLTQLILGAFATMLAPFCVWSDGVPVRGAG